VPGLVICVIITSLYNTALQQTKICDSLNQPGSFRLKFEKVIKAKLLIPPENLQLFELSKYQACIHMCCHSIFEFICLTNKNVPHRMAWQFNAKA
jgi:hypothetical protein